MTDTTSSHPDLEAGETSSTLPPKRSDSRLLNALQRPGTKAPKDALKAVYAAGVYKANLPLDILLVQTFMAGFYIAMAGQFFLSVGGDFLGAAMFPVGLVAVVLTSGELFTGDALVFVTAWLGQKVTSQQLARNWTVAWLGNFVGALTWAALLSYASDALHDKGQVELAIHIAQKKALQPWFHIFLKGIGANAMVCLGIWMATCSEEVAGKILAIWFPTTGFVIMGFEHSIANQYFLPLGMMLMAQHPEIEGPRITVQHLLFKALLPATLGNLVGGGIFIGAIYWYAFDSMESMNRVRERIGRAWSSRPHYHHKKQDPQEQASQDSA
jgi:formate/nitrite transporter